MTPETDQELIEEIRALNAAIGVDEQELQKKKELLQKYIDELDNSLGQIVHQLAESRRLI